MAPNESMVALPGSERILLEGARLVGEADPNEPLQITIYVRKNPEAQALPAVEEMAMLLPAQRDYLSNEQITAMHGAHQNDLDAVVQYMTAQGFQVDEVNQAARSVRLSGTVAQVKQTFQVQLNRYAHAERGDYRGRTGAIYIPLPLRGVIRAIFGLDNRRIGRSFRRSAATPVAFRAATHPHGFLPTQLAKLYNFPAQANGSGQCIAILAFNGQLADTGVNAQGGYTKEVLQAYFENQLGLTLPDIADVVVHGPGNVPGDETQDTDSTGEILLDLQVVGGTAPGAKIRVYFTEFTEQGWVDVLNAVVHDTTNNPSILSISYGNAETLSNSANINQRGSLWTLAAIEQTNIAFQAAALKGITILCASGDAGTSDGAGDGRAHVDFPASSPFVLACGGTRLTATSAGAYKSEAVWNDGPGDAGGGGISDLFPVPTWQQNAGVPSSVNPGHHIGRGVPDVAADADPMSGVIISDINGNVDRIHPTGGTSAAAPLWAGLVARLNQASGARMGFMNPLLYTKFATGVLHDITKGNNMGYRATSGWDACTGLGTPDGVRLLQSFTTGHAPGHIVQTSPPVAAGMGEEIAALQARVAALEASLRKLQPPMELPEMAAVGFAPTPEYAE